MEFPELWCTVKVKNEPTEVNEALVPEMPITPPDQHEIDVKVQVSIPGVESVEVKSFDTTAPGVTAIKLEPGEPDSSEPVYTSDNPLKTEQLDYEQASIKRELPEPASEDLPEDNWNSDGFDDVPVFYGAYVQNAVPADTSNISEGGNKKHCSDAHWKRKPNAAGLSHTKSKVQSLKLYPEKPTAAAETKRKKRSRKSRQPNGEPTKHMGRPAKRNKKQREETQKEEESCLQAHAVVEGIQHQNERSEDEAAGNKVSLKARKGGLWEVTPEQQCVIVVTRHRKKKEKEETQEEPKAQRQAQTESARLRCQNQTLEQQEARNEAILEARQKHLMEETPEQQEKRLAHRAIIVMRHRQKKEKAETPEERKARLQGLAVAARIRRQNQTPEQRAAKSKVSAEARQRRLMKETPEQREKRLFLHAQRMRENRQKRAMLLDRSMVGLEEIKQKAALSLESERWVHSEVEEQDETEKQQAQLKYRAEAARQKRQNETPEQKTIRRRAHAEACRKWRQSKRAAEQQQCQFPGQVVQQKPLLEKKYSQSEEKAISDTKMDMAGRENEVNLPKKGAKDYQCDICDALFSNSKSLTTHKYIHTGHFVPDRTFVCRFCGAAVNDCMTYNDHLQKNHREMCSFLCEFCGAVFYHNESLKIHLRRHSGQRPYKCHLCAASFTSAGGLRNHHRTHTNERPYSCSVCQATFRYSSALTSHMRTHTNKRPYVCRDCEASFKYPGDLKRHIRTLKCLI